MVENLRMQRDNCMHCSTPVYIRDLSIGRFWYLQGVLESIPHEYQGTTEVLEREKWYKQIFDYLSICLLSICIIQGLTVHFMGSIIQSNSNSFLPFIHGVAFICITCPYVVINKYSVHIIILNTVICQVYFKKKIKDFYYTFIYLFSYILLI